MNKGINVSVASFIYSKSFRNRCKSPVYSVEYHKCMCVQAHRPSNEADSLMQALVPSLELTEWLFCSQIHDDHGPLDFPCHLDNLLWRWVRTPMAKSLFSAVSSIEPLLMQRTFHIAAPHNMAKSNWAWTTTFAIWVMAWIGGMVK